MRAVRSTLLLVSLVAAPACGSASSPADTPPAAATSVDPATAGTLAGRVTLQGPEPAEEHVRLDADPQCVTLNGTDRGPAGALVTGRDRALHNVFVYVKNGLEKTSFPVPNDPVIVDQQKCRYVPRVVGVRVGQPLVIRNSDPLLHNVRSASTINQPFNQGQPVQGMVFTHTFTTREVMVPVTCDVHRWMRTSVGVLEHPYFAVSDEAGTFTLPNLPPGTYTLEAWHERLGTREQQVALAPRESAHVEFAFAR